LRALLLQVLYSVRSERMLMELEYNLLFRWFVDLGMDDAIWVPTTFRKIAIGCWMATSRGPSLKMSSRRPAGTDSCPLSINGSTGVGRGGYRRSPDAARRDRCPTNSRWSSSRVLA
jgi:hypothetical protein